MALEFWTISQFQFGYFLFFKQTRFIFLFTPFSSIPIPYLFILSLYLFSLYSSFFHCCYCQVIDDNCVNAYILMMMTLTLNIYFINLMMGTLSSFIIMIIGKLGERIKETLLRIYKDKRKEASSPFRRNKMNEEKLKERQQKYDHNFNVDITYIRTKRTSGWLLFGLWIVIVVARFIQVSMEIQRRLRTCEYEWILFSFCFIHIVGVALFIIHFSV